jgi:predicted metalloenzyme YecM
VNDTTFRQEAYTFLEDVFNDLKTNHIEILNSWEIDHICYRADSLKTYEELKENFSQFGELLIEAPVSGRPIATYKLKTPIKFKDWIIGLVELPAPKASKITKKGFEHIEVVIDLSFETLQERYKHLTLDLKGLAKELNPELEIVLGERNIKFHHQSLEKVIEIEKEQMRKDLGIRS